MILSDEAITEFQDLYELKFGKRPSREEAESDLLLLMKIVAETRPSKRCTTEVA